MAILKFSVYCSFVRQAVMLGMEEIGLYGCGEPFLVKDLDRYISFAKEVGIKRVYVTTNGALASLSFVKRCVSAGLDSIKYSINAANRDDYSIVHGVDDFDVVEKNVRDVDEWRKRENVDIQLLCSCISIPSLGSVRLQHYERFGSYFDDVLYVKSGNQGGGSLELTSVYGGDFSSIFYEDLSCGKNAEVCSMIWNRYHLTAEGYMSACCVDYELDLVYGDIRDEELSVLWNNEVIKRLRQQHLRKDLAGTLCNLCADNKYHSYRPLYNVPYPKKGEDIVGKMVSDIFARKEVLEERRREHP